MNMNNLGMVVFLFIAAVPNVLFSARSLRDYVSRDSHLRKALPSAPPALLSTAIAEMSWVLPCLVQCFASLFDASFLPDNNETACNVMGFYSLVGSFWGMGSTLWTVIITYASITSRAVPEVVSKRVCILVFLFSILMAAIPLLVEGSMHFTEGFCYADFTHPALAALMLVVNTAIILTTLSLLILCLTHQGWPSQVDLILMLLGFLSAWLLWVPASIIGLSGATFPKHFFISGGVMGHAQALVNPYIYGVRWRASAMKRDGIQQDATPKKATGSVPILNATPPMSGCIASAPPSPPAEQQVFARGSGASVAPHVV